MFYFWLIFEISTKHLREHNEWAKAKVWMLRPWEERSQRSAPTATTQPKLKERPTRRARVGCSNHLTRSLSLTFLVGGRAAFCDARRRSLNARGFTDTKQLLSLHWFLHKKVTALKYSFYKIRSERGRVFISIVTYLHTPLHANVFAPGEGKPLLLLSVWETSNTSTELVFSRWFLYKFSLRFDKTVSSSACVRALAQVVAVAFGLLLVMNRKNNKFLLL